MPGTRQNLYGGQLEVVSTFESQEILRMALDFPVMLLKNLALTYCVG